jgi:prolyl oligopeptidase
MDGRLFVELYRNYRSAIVELTSSGSGWTARTVPLEKDRFLSLLDTHDGKLFVKVEAPLVPEKLVLADAQTGAATVLYQRKAAFDTRNLVAELRQTQSRDGTPISYTLIRRKDLKRDGTNPTLVYGYGGYDVAVTPRYEPIFGKLWLQKGGTYVHAYLRGGGENGPDWHRGPMRKNRQQPYDDMAAVLEDLQRSRVSSPQHIGIMGRSNGGLMTAVMMEQRPELMNAVVVGGPLIDMLNFHELAPGASWTAEYGDPRDPDMRAFLATYSPMQNIRTGVRYPKPLIITSLDDDRVLPGHARRFAARLTEAGHDNYYFEDQQGGHYWELAGGPAPGDWRLRSVARAVEFAYLWQQLRSSPNKGK